MYVLGYEEKFKGKEVTEATIINLDMIELERLIKTSCVF